MREDATFSLCLVCFCLLLFLHLCMLFPLLALLLRLDVVVASVGYTLCDLVSKELRIFMLVLWPRY